MFNFGNQITIGSKGRSIRFLHPPSVIGLNYFVCVNPFHVKHILQSSSLLVFLELLVGRPGSVRAHYLNQLLDTNSNCLLNVDY